MSDFKDLFSERSDEYKAFRPTYPEALFDAIAKQAPNLGSVWDCGTGNGQGAALLAEHFKHVYATDPSANQIEHALLRDNIDYSVATAENSQLPDQSVSVVTVFQALHWFDLGAFAKEVKRVCQPGGLLVAVGYNTALTGIDIVDETYKYFCFDFLWESGSWAMERESINSGYSNVSFPFTPLPEPEFFIEMHWNYADYISYLNTWSAVKTYKKQFNENPVDKIVVPRIKDHWPQPDEKRLVRFPLVIKLWKI